MSQTGAPKAPLTCRHLRTPEPHPLPPSAGSGEASD